MNKKGKPKNRPNKPQNPTPPQTDDTSKNEPEKPVIDEITQLETKPAETVQEILSDMVVIEADDDDFESPKKPKRNRAKKKKDVPEVIEDKTQAQGVKDETNIKQEAAVKSAAQIASDETKPISPLPVEAASRKKKGKKGAQETKEQATIVTQDLSTKVDSTPLVEPSASEIQDQDNKTKKKNKKGKKRTDSERSDKGEETVLCTAAFQKILQPRTDTDTKKDCKKSETAEPKTTTEPETVKKDKEDADNKQIKADKKDKPLKPIDEPNIPIKPNKGEMKIEKESLKKDSKTENKQEKEDKTEKIENKSQQIDTFPIVAKAEEPIAIPEKTETIIDKPITQQTPQKPKKDKHKGKKEADNIMAKELEALILQVEPEKQKDAIQPKVQALDKIKFVEDVAPKDIKESSTDDISQKKNKKDKKSKDMPVEAQLPPKENIIEPVKLSDILNLLDPTTKQKIENQQKKLITDDPVILKTETPQEQSVKISHPNPSVKLETTISDSEHVQNPATLEKEIIKTTEIKLEEQKSTGAKPKAKIAKPVEKSKGKSKPDTSTELEVIKDSFLSQPTVEACKEDTLSHDTVKVDIEPDNVKKELIAVPYKSEAFTPLIETIHIKTIVDPPTNLEGNIQNVSAKVVEKPASDVLLENIEKPLKESEAMPIQADAANLQCPQEKSRKKRKSPKLERKLKDVSEPAPKSEIKDVTNIEKISETEIKQKVSEEVSKKERKVEEKSPPFELTDTDEELVFFEKKIVTPDQIEYPRSASVQSTDGNNNMMIEEINEPFIIPIIDEVPLLEEEPSKVPVDLSKPATKYDQVTEAAIEKVKDKAKAEPKQTDLKTKVLEVNKDMEGLRLSIERSLAELSALEKCEEEIFKPNVPKTQSSYKVKQQISQSIDNQPSSELIQADVIVVDAPVAAPIALPISLPETIKCEQKTIEAPEKSLDKAIDLPTLEQLQAPPTPPQRKDNKGKNKSKKKGKQETSTQTTGQTTSTSITTADSQKSSEATQKEDNKDTKTEKDSKNEEKRQNDSMETSKDSESKSKKPSDNTGALIENFEDALTTSVDDVNTAFDVISNEVDKQNNDEIQSKLTEDDSTEPEESKKADEERKAKENPVSQPKNFLGHPYNPVPSNKIDYKKEKNKPPNEILAEINIKDSVDIEPKNTKVSKESQTFGKEKIKSKNTNEAVSVTNDNEEYIYKYSFRNVYLSNACHLCKKDLKTCRVECSLCHLIFYCSQKHKEEDYVQHQSLCFAVSTLSHLKGTKHIYGDAQNITGYNYRLLRMQTIVSCEKILKRKLLPWEQEALLYPRMCAEPTCREWRNENLKDCTECGQVSFCSTNPAHLSTIHQRWCASYSLYHKLVVHQLTEGRLEPRLPTKVLNCHNITDSINRLFADMYEEKIDMNDIEYASLTQLATAPLTAAYGYQLYRNRMSQAFPRQDFKKPSFTIHVIGAELQFEADSLSKWEKFFLHIKPELETLNVVLIGPELNPAGLPTHLLGKIKMCPNCRVDKRRLEFSFQDNKHYHEYCNSDEYTEPDLICAFNPSIQRASSYTQNDQWIATLNCIVKRKLPFLVTAYTMTEIQRDMNAIRKLVSQRVNVISEAKFNPFASVRPDRNFISDDEMPLLFKNYCYMVLIGALG